MGVFCYFVLSLGLFIICSALFGFEETLWGFGVVHWLSTIGVLYSIGAAIDGQEQEAKSAGIAALEMPVSLD
jgi:hypothetical protein